MYVYIHICVYICITSVLTTTHTSADTMPSINHRSRYSTNSFFLLPGSAPVDISRCSRCLLAPAVGVMSLLSTPQPVAGRLSRLPCRTPRDHSYDSRRCIVGRDAYTNSQKSVS